MEIVFNVEEKARKLQIGIFIEDVPFCGGVIIIGDEETTQCVSLQLELTEFVTRKKQVETVFARTDGLDLQVQGGILCKIHLESIFAKKN